MVEYSAEQEAIISLALPPPEPDTKRNVDIIRVTSAAGSGKTTTLEGFGKELIRLQHTDIFYVTFSKAAVADAEQRLDECIECRTIHSAALKELKESMEFYPADMELEDESRLDAYILENYRDSIDEFLSSVRLRAWQNANDPLLSYRKKVAFFIRKTLTRFLQSADTLSDGLDPCNGFNTYFPARKWHGFKNSWAGGHAEPKVPGLTNDPALYQKFYVGHAKKLFDALRYGKEGYVSFDMIVKEAQLQEVQFPCDALLVDESQDCTECQISLVTNQKEFGAQVVLVGDAVQTIYGFRGCKAKNLMELPVRCIDRSLTNSYRFGPEIAAIANTILFCKEFSPQTTVKNTSWIPYRVKGESGIQGSIGDHKKTFPDGEQYTVIGRTNLSLFDFCLEKLIGQELEVKVAINGKGESSGRGKWKSMFKTIDDLYSLYQGNSNAIKNWKEFTGENITSWGMFTAAVNNRELNQYKGHIYLIEHYKHKTPGVVQRFEESVLDKHYSPEESDVILTTVHAAKGMEWENVKILDDDFVELSRFKFEKSYYKEETAQFDIKSWGDDLNLWYVAVTRARKKLSLPPKFIDLITSLDVILKYGPIIDQVLPSTQDSILEKIRVSDVWPQPDRSPQIDEFKVLYETLAIHWKKEMNSVSTDDFNIRDLSTDESMPMPRIKRPRLVSP